MANKAGSIVLAGLADPAVQTAVQALGVAGAWQPGITTATIPDGGGATGTFGAGSQVVRALSSDDGAGNDVAMPSLSDPSIKTGGVYILRNAQDTEALDLTADGTNVFSPGGATVTLAAGKAVHLVASVSDGTWYVVTGPS